MKRKNEISKNNPNKKKVEDVLYFVKDSNFFVKKENKKTVRGISYDSGKFLHLFSYLLANKTPREIINLAFSHSINISKLISASKKNERCDLFNYKRDKPLLIEPATDDEFSGVFCFIVEDMSFLKGLEFIDRTKNINEVIVEEVLYTIIRGVQAYIEKSWDDSKPVPLEKVLNSQKYLAEMFGSEKYFETAIQVNLNLIRSPIYQHINIFKFKDIFTKKQYEKKRPKKKSVSPKKGYKERTKIESDNSVLERVMIILISLYPEILDKDNGLTAEMLLDAIYPPEIRSAAGVGREKALDKLKTKFGMKSPKSMSRHV